MNAIAPRMAITPTVAPIPIPAFTTPLSLALLLPALVPAVGDGIKVVEDVRLWEEDDEEIIKLKLEIDDKEDIVEELDVELVDEENVLASSFVLDVNVTPTGSSVPTFPFGSSATSWAWQATGKVACVGSSVNIIYGKEPEGWT